MLIFSIYIPFVQNIITSKIENEIAEQLNAEVSIQEFSLSFLADINLKAVEIRQQSDTLLKLNKIVIDIELLPLFSKQVVVDEIEIIGLNTDVYKLIPDETSSDNTEKKAVSENLNWGVSVNNISVINSKIILADKNSGMDIRLDVGEFTINKLQLDSFVVTAQNAKIIDTKISYLWPYSPTEPIDTSVIDLVLAISNTNIINSQISYNDSLMSFTAVAKAIKFKDYFFSFADENISFAKAEADSLCYNLIFINDSIIIPESEINWKVKGDYLSLKQSNFTLDIPYLVSNDTMFDYNHIHFTDINSSVNNMFYSVNKISGQLNNLSIIESNKFVVKNASGKFSVDNKKAILTDLKIKTQESTVSMNMSTGYNIKDWEFTETEQTNLDLYFETKEWADIDYFIGDLLLDIPNIKKLKNKRIVINTKLNGTIDSLNLITKFEYNNTFSLSTQGYISDLEKEDSINFDLDILELEVYKEDIALFIDDKSTLEYIPELSLVDGNIKGTTNKIYYTGDLKSDYGSQNIIAYINTTASSPLIKASIKGNFIAQKYNKLSIDSINITTEFTGNAIDNIKTYADIKFKKIKIDTLFYDNLQSQFSLEKGNYKLKLFSSDKNADFIVESEGVLNDSIINAKTKLNIVNIGFKERSLFDNKIDVKLNSQINLKFNFNSNNAELDANIWNISTTDSLEVNSIEKLNIDFTYKQEETSFSLLSDNNIIKANVYGSLDTLIKNYMKFIDILILEKDINDTLYFPSFDFYADLKKPYEIINTSISENLPQYSELIIKTNYNSDKGLDFNLFLPDLEYADNKFDSTSINIVGNLNGLSYLLKSKISLDSTLNTKIIIEGDYKHKELFTHLNLTDNNKRDFLNLNFRAKENELGYYISLLDDSLTILSNRWHVNKQNSIEIRKDDFVASNFSLNRANKQIKIETDSLTDKLELSLKNIDLSVFNNILSNDSLLSGNANANLAVLYNKKTPFVRLTANIDTFKFDNYKVGNIKIENATLNKENFTFNSSIKNTNNLAKFSGTIIIDESKEINIISDIKALDLNILNSFLDDYLYDVSGKISSKINITGTTDNPKLDGFVDFKNAKFGLVDLNESFKINNERIKFENNKILLDKIKIIDRNGHKTHFTGNIQYKENDIFFENFTLKSDAIELMNSEQTNEALVYGLIKAELNIKMNGSLHNLTSKSKIILDYPTKINYVFPEDLSIENNKELVNFTKIDTLNIIDTLLNSKKEYSNRLAMFKSLEAELVVKSGCKFNIFFDSSMEDYLNVAVAGDIKYIITNNTAKTFGLLNIDKGNMSYSLPMVTMDKLKIEEGSYIQILNDISKPFLSINTSTKIWAQTGGLIEDYNRNLEVTVLIYMKGSLDNLIIQFDLLSETNDPLISSKISQMTDKERSVNAVNLLVRGEFATNQSSVGMGMDSYTSELIANALNVLISDRIKFVDMSFDMKSYKNYNSSGNIEAQSNIFFNVGKSFYNDRIRIKYTSSLTTNTTQEGENYGQIENQTQSNLSLEYDINQSGSLQGLLFRKNAYDDIMEGEIISTGGGFRIRKRYSSFGDIFKFKKDSITK